tara:strand:+ start:2474 stop:3637 length:1164 start_codon:yes stop_codon:yes gene_type:complete
MKTKLLNLTKNLIKRKSITPIDDGAILILKQKLGKLGFTNIDLPFQSKNQARVLNLFSILKNNKKSNKILCFAGHTDVVPPGKIEDWKYDPFEGKITKNKIYGRGASDMKGAIAAWVNACENILKNNKLNFSLALMITGDEEGVAENGTTKIVAWLKRKKIKIDHCIVGEPTNPNYIGEMIKIGRRGSLSIKLRIRGNPGHVAYPHLADNPLYYVGKISNDLCDLQLQKASKNFPISNLEITSIDTGNKASNVIPSSAEISLNIRYNNKYNDKEILNKIKKICQKYNCKFSILIISNNKPFYTSPDDFVKTFVKSVKIVTGKTPLLSTTGGTSDARFIKDICPVIEFGAVGKTMHKINENVFIKDLITLQKIYETFILHYNSLCEKN